MLVWVFFVVYVVIMVLLALRRYVPAWHDLLNHHPLGEWGMYSVPVRVESYSVTLNIENKKKDITKISNSFLWHNLSGGKWVTISHPDLPLEAFNQFPFFLAQQPEIRSLAKSKKGKVVVRLSYMRGTDPNTVSAEASL